MIKTIVCFFIAAMLVSCRTTTAPESSGTMTGKVGLRDTSCDYIVPDGVTVELLGTKFIGISDTGGVWNISGIPAGYYDIQLSKPGFARSRLYNVEFAGAGTLDFNQHLPMADFANLGTKTTSTIAISNVAVTTASSKGPPMRYADDSIVSVSVESLDAKTTLTLNDAVVLYGSKTPNVDPLDPSTYFFLSTNNFQNQPFLINFSEKALGMHAGDTVYVTVAGMSWCSTGSYSDPSGNTIFPGVGPLSMPVPVIIP